MVHSDQELNKWARASGSLQRAETFTNGWAPNARCLLASPERQYLKAYSQLRQRD